MGWFTFQEPVIRPAWNTFVSSVSGIWKGVGAVFSPMTAEMEPIDIGNKSEHLYDCYTLSCIKAVSSSLGGQSSRIQRKTNWVTLNPYGELRHQKGGGNRMQKELSDKDEPSSTAKEVDGDAANPILPKFESFDFGTSDVMEEDIMDHEPGLVFFEVDLTPFPLLTHTIIWIIFQSLVLTLFIFNTLLLYLSKEKFIWINMDRKLTPWD